MPIYVYECETCGLRIERIFTSRKQPTKLFLPHGTGSCDITKPTWKRIIAPTNFQLKGTGWAKDNYANKKRN